MGFTPYRPPAGSVGQSQVQNGYVDLSTAQTVGGVKTFSSQIETPDGSAATPGIQIGTDADTGLYRDAVKGVVAAVDGADRLRLKVADISEFVGTFARVLGVTNAVGTITYAVVSGAPEGVTPSSPGSLAHDATNGRLYLKRTGTGNTGWVQIDRCESGTWTPTATIVANLDAVTPGVSIYSRVGDIVHCEVPFTADPTAGSAFSFRVSLPAGHTSNFTATNDAIGVGGWASNSFLAYADADTTNDQVLITVANNQTALLGNGKASFSYRVLP